MTKTKAKAKKPKGRASFMPKPKLEVFGDRILVLPIKEEDQIEGSTLYRPDTSKERPSRAHVVGFGSAVTLGLEVGEVVAYGKYDGYEWPEDSFTFVVLREKEITGRVR